MNDFIEYFIKEKEELIMKHYDLTPFQARTDFRMFLAGLRVDDAIKEIFDKHLLEDLKEKFYLFRKAQ